MSALSVLYSILLTIHVLVCLLLVLLVMLQRPKQEGLGSAFASGMMNDIAGPNTTDVLQKGTRMMAITFFVLSTCLAVLKAHEHRQNEGEAPEPATEEVETVPLDLSPNTPQDGSQVPLLDDIQPVAPEMTPGTDETPAPETGEAPAETPAPEGEAAPAEDGAEQPKAEGEAAAETPAPEAGSEPAPATEEPAAESGEPKPETEAEAEAPKPAQS